MEYASKDIRNILVAGHAGCGKTTLTESLLYLSGATERMGRVEDGTTASDFDPEEVRRKASLNSSVVPVEYEGIKYNLIDVPGLFDFETGAAEGIMAAESVLICVSGRSGVTVGAEKAYQLALKHNKARMVFVTKADRLLQDPGADEDQVRPQRLPLCRAGPPGRRHRRLHQPVQPESL